MAYAANYFRANRENLGTSNRRFADSRRQRLDGGENGACVLGALTFENLVKHEKAHPRVTDASVKIRVERWLTTLPRNASDYFPVFQTPAVSVTDVVPASTEPMAPPRRRDSTGSYVTQAESRLMYPARSTLTVVGARVFSAPSAKPGTSRLPNAPERRTRGQAVPSRLVVEQKVPKLVLHTTAGTAVSGSRLPKPASSVSNRESSKSSKGGKSEAKAPKRK